MQITKIRRQPWREYEILIEPQWNVDADVLENAQYTNVNFNRTIVECRYILAAMNPSNKYDFNRTIVECRFKKDGINTIYNEDFNRTIVECRYICWYEKL